MSFDPHGRASSISEMLSDTSQIGRGSTQALFALPPLSLPPPERRRSSIVRTLLRSVEDTPLARAGSFGDLESSTVSHPLQLDRRRSSTLSVADTAAGRRSSESLLLAAASLEDVPFSVPSSSVSGLQRQRPSEGFHEVPLKRHRSSRASQDAGDTRGSIDQLPSHSRASSFEEDEIYALAMRPQVFPQDRLAEATANMLRQLMPGMSSESPVLSPQPNFRLMHQPNESQRKSYSNENRYIHPSPLLIEYCGTSTPLHGGVVSVRLAKESCVLLTEDIQMSLVGDKLSPLDETGRTGFALKVQRTSLGSKFRLIFQVTYFVGDWCFRENVVSRAFRVDSNKPKNSEQEQVEAVALLPKSGPNNEETEVWIRGKAFAAAKRTFVTFGGRKADVVETSDRLIIVRAPVRLDLRTPTTVDVMVDSRTGKRLAGDKEVVRLRYTYIPRV